MGGWRCGRMWEWVGGGVVGGGNGWNLSLSTDKHAHFISATICNHTPDVIFPPTLVMTPSHPHNGFLLDSHPTPPRMVAPPTSMIPIMSPLPHVLSLVHIHVAM